MKVRVLGAYGGEIGPHRNSAFLVNGCLLIDAGGASAAMSTAEARGLKACVLTHSHLDHVASIPFILDIRIGGEPLDVFALPETIAALRSNLFSGALFPNFERIPDPSRPLLRFREIQVGRRFTVAGVEILPVKVDHTVPTVGYIVSEGTSSVVFSADTAPTEEIWAVTRDRTGVGGVFLEVSFPRRFDEVAKLSKHISTISLGAELAKIPERIPVFLNHMKPALLAEIQAEVAPLMKTRPGLAYAEQDRTYEF